MLREERRRRGKTVNDYMALGYSLAMFLARVTEERTPDDSRTGEAATFSATPRPLETLGALRE
jgi:hypothetical protein